MSLKRKALETTFDIEPSQGGENLANPLAPQGYPESPVQQQESAIRQQEESNLPTPVGGAGVDDKPKTMDLGSGEVMPSDPPAPSIPVRLPSPEGYTTATISKDHPLYEAVKAFEDYSAKGPAENTKSSYQHDWDHFQKWCKSKDVESLPTTPYTVSLYISEIAKGGNGEPKKKVSTIVRRLAAINAVHKEAGHIQPAKQKYPDISKALQGIKREKGMAQEGKRPLGVKMAVSLLNQQSMNSIISARDSVILLLGLAGAFRRSELATIKFEHITYHRHGITIRIPYSKTDQVGEGREVEIPLGKMRETCPVAAIDNWVAIANIPREGYLLRAVDRWGNVSASEKPIDSGAISRVIKRRAKAAGYDDKSYSGHSLRAGFVTAAAANGATDRQIMRQTGHKSQKMIDRYSRREQDDRRAAAEKVGL